MIYKVTSMQQRDAKENPWETLILKIVMKKEQPMRMTQ